MKRKYRQKRKRGRGLLGADWPKIYRHLQPYLRRKKQTGGSWGSLFNWGFKKLATSNKLSKFINNPNSGAKFLNRFV